MYAMISGLRWIFFFFFLLKVQRTLCVHLDFNSFTAVKTAFHQGSPTWCPQAPGRPQGPHKLFAGLF